MNQISQNFKSRSQPPSEVERLIESLRLAAHPEGGWFRETWRAPAHAGDRAAGTAILFLLEAGKVSQWHQVDADELWLWHAGSALDLKVADSAGDRAHQVIVGPDVLSGEEPQLLIPAGWWQTASAARGWALVSCVVVPGFDFAGFKFASPDWATQLDTSIR